MVFAVELQLYMPLTVCLGMPRVCACGEPTDPRGHHVLQCLLTDANKVRHDIFTKLFARTLRELGIVANWEPKYRYPENPAARADLELPHIRSMGPIECDLTIVTPWATGGELVRRGNESGRAAKAAEKNKREKYEGNGLRRRADNPKLYTLAIEVCGRRGEEWRRFDRYISTRLEELKWGPRWRYYRDIVPKYNAWLTIETYQKALTVGKRIQQVYCDRCLST